MLGRSSGNDDWLLANASACVETGLRQLNYSICRRNTEKTLSLLHCKMVNKRGCLFLQFVGYHHTSRSCPRAPRWSRVEPSTWPVSPWVHRCRTFAGDVARSTCHRSPGRSTRRRRSARTYCSWRTSVRPPRTRVSRPQSSAASNTMPRSASEVSTPTLPIYWFKTYG